MNKIEQIPTLIRQGLTNSQIAKKLKLTTSTISSYRNGFPCQKVVNILNNNPEFKNEFFELYKTKTIKEIVPILQKNPIFKRIKISSQRVYEYKKFYDIPSNMHERKYDSDTDRIKGYMIRNSKFTSKRRNIEFNLDYKDFELPEYCPLLNIKLTFRLESNGNDNCHASLDRINNSKGYIKGNVIVISRLANQMKNSANFEELETFAKNILKLTNHYKNQDALGSITDIFPNIILKT